MSKKQLIIAVITAISVVLSCMTAGLCQEAGETPPRLVTDLGIIYVGMTKERLKDVGFTDDTLVSYDKQDNMEFMTFSNWTTPGEGDTITFYIEDGVITDWSKGGVLMPVDNTGD